jgi:hypothetical protein
LGDSIYDETYIPSPLDFTEKEWMRFEKEFQQKLDNTKIVASFGKTFR